MGNCIRNSIEDSSDDSDSEISFEKRVVSKPTALHGHHHGRRKISRMQQAEDSEDSDEDDEEEEAWGAWAAEENANVSKKDEKKKEKSKGKSAAKILGFD